MFLVGSKVSVLG